MDVLRQIIALLHLRDIATGIADGVVWLVSLATGPELANRFAAAIQLDLLARSSVYTIVMVVGLFAIIFPLERLTRSRRVAYAGRTFRQDVLYSLFYMGGFYDVLLWSALANLLKDNLAFLKFDVLAALPGPVHWVIYWISVDLITYWWHRSLHTSRILWAVHSVHHAQPEMSFISSYRAHPLEQFMQNLIMVVPLLVMGVPTFSWLPLIVFRSMLEGLQHSAIDWDYGRCYTLFVSPRFHALHHSRDPGQYNGNYSKILSVWDFAFGTAVRAERRPEVLGVAGMPVPRTIGAQMLAPFRQLRSQWLARGEAGPATARS